MAEMNIPKEVLVKTISENRKKHKETAETAWKNYMKKLEEAFSEKLVSVRAGKKTDHYINLEAPINKTHEYDRILKMLEVTSDTVISLNERSFAELMMDEWSWQQEFRGKNAPYTMS